MAKDQSKDAPKIKVGSKLTAGAASGLGRLQKVKMQKKAGK